MVPRKNTIVLDGGLAKDIDVRLKFRRIVRKYPANNNSWPRVLLQDTRGHFNLIYTQLSVMKYLSLLFFASLAFTGCSELSAPAKSGIAIDVPQALETVSETEGRNISDSVWYVALTAPATHMQGYITKAVGYRRKIYCLDELQSRSLNVYDSAGRFLYQLAPRGKGPQEALNISDFSIFGDEVFVTDILQKRVQVYRADNGQFIRTIRLPFAAYECHRMADNRMVFILSPYNEDLGDDYLLHEVLTTDSLLHPIRFQVARPYPDRGAVSRSQWNAFCGPSELFTIFGESIYRYDPAADSMVYVVGFDYGRENVPQEALADYRRYMRYYDDDRMRLTSESPWVIGSYIFGSINKGQAKYHVMYDGHETLAREIRPETYDVTDPLFPVGFVQDDPATLISYVEPMLGVPQLVDRQIKMADGKVVDTDEYPLVLLFTKLK